jgi:bifunctional non-homologous end joining protein LigD
VIEPMKAVLSDQPFSDPDWIFERKLDGIRCIAIRDGSGVSLMSRTSHRMNDQFPEIAEALEREPAEDFILDGEVVAMRDGVSSFELLQQRHRRRVPVYYYVFDLPGLKGEDLRPLPLRERKARLRRTLEFKGPIRFNPHRRGEHGEELFREACRKGLEGVIAKRADSPYTGTRSRDWLKLKCHAEQELVIGGFTAPKGSRTEFGALLVGYNEDGALRYAGKVGTGFDQATLRELGATLRELEQDESPFPAFKPIPPGTRWVRPELVAQVGFSEWTRDGRLRHPRFLGLRDDKPASEVVREVPS